MPNRRVKWAVVLGLWILVLRSAAHADVPRTGVISILEIRLLDMHALEDLTSDGYDVAGVRGDVATVYATQEEKARLIREGFAAVEVGREPSDSKGTGGYHTYETLTTALQAYAAAYPNSCRLSSLGQSFRGRELWAVLITRNPDVEEDEPEFKYVSTIHGDEPVGMENCLRFIELLLRSDGADDRIAGLINTTAIWIVPLMNPDGLAAGKRYNGQGFDLNRRFPAYPDGFSGTIFDDGAPETSGRPVEVALMMEWTAAHHFVLSANFHAGSLVVNYPYDDDDTTSARHDAPAPDDALFRDIAMRYSRNNPPMWNSAYFDDGITNGAAWYVISGGMQDWNYRYMGCNEVTIELSNTKTPASSTLTTLWNNNRESMLEYLEAVHIGVRGIVTDRLTGEPLYACVRVHGNAQPVFTDPGVGDYHRMLLPGTYTLTASAPGYVPQRTGTIVVTDGPASRADLSLVTGDLTDDTLVTPVDIQRIVNHLLGTDSTCRCDVDGGGVEASDLQAVINAVLGVY